MISFYILKNVPFKRPVIVVRALVLLKSLLAIEKLLAVFYWTLEKHFISKYNLLFLSKTSRTSALVFKLFALFREIIRLIKKNWAIGSQLNYKQINESCTARNQSRKSKVRANRYLTFNISHSYKFIQAIFQIFGVLGFWGFVVIPTSILFF